MSLSRAETLEQLAKLCRAGRDPSALTSAPSEVPEIDAALPGGGWPVGAIVELLSTQVGIGELRLVMPTLARMTRAERYVALVAPPYVPFAPALAQHGIDLKYLLVIDARSSEDALWAFEQTLRCRSFDAALAWTAVVKDREVRRLQLAAEAGRSIGFLYRPGAAARESSPAAVRLQLQRDTQGLAIEILKCRGTNNGRKIALSSSRESALSHAANAHAAR
jgi:hypothetical protein